MKYDYPFAGWEIPNQARMHYKNNFQPHVSTDDGLGNWVETATCVGIRLHKAEFEYLYRCGADDLFNMAARQFNNFKGLRR